jgi:LPPG:FO 2-phospho-L-lactate transferase
VLLALAGGVGGAKLAQGLSRILRPEDLAIVVNVGDDFEDLGLHVSPDIDTVVYTLAGIANPETGWGIAGETWSFMDALGVLGGETWFRLGDRDLATHIERTRLLATGAPLSDVTMQLARKLGVAAAIIPASGSHPNPRRYRRRGVGIPALFCTPALRAAGFAPVLLQRGDGETGRG